METLYIKKTGAIAAIDTERSAKIPYLELQTLLRYRDKSAEYARRQYSSEPVWVGCLSPELTFGSGLISYLKKGLPHWNIQVLETPATAKLINPTKDWSWLYNHQKEAVQAALTHKCGTIVIPAGGGKTITFAYFLDHFPDERALIIVPSKDLVTQVTAELTKTLDEEIGQIGDGKSKWRRITVGIVNSLINDKHKAELKQIKIIIRDEAHRAAAASHQLLNERLPSVEYSLGFSATNFRSDGKDLLIEAACGPLIYKVLEDDLQKKKQLMAVKHCFLTDKQLQITVPSDYSLHMRQFGKPELSYVYTKAVVENKQRNKFIIEVLNLVLKSPVRTGGVLVIIERTAHGEALFELAKEYGIYLPFIYGSSNSKDRQDIVENLRGNALDCACVSKIFNEGQNIKPLQFLINAAAGSGAALTIQRSGRLSRVDSGKGKPVYIDLIDQEQYYGAGQSDKRMHHIRDRFGADAVNVMKLDKFKKEVLKLD